MESTTLKTVAQAVKTATRGHFNFSVLIGPDNKAVRAAILSALTGRKVPLSKAGFTVLLDTLMNAYGATGNCLAARENDLQSKMEALIGAE